MSIIIPGLILVFLLIVMAFIMVLNAETNEKNSVFGGLEMVLFLVMMPKNPTKKETTSSGQPQKEEKLTIAQMEQVFANFLYLKKPKAFQVPPCCAFEIASQIGSADISFYVAVPKYLESVFEKYVQGVYPNAVVDKVPQDYTIFEPQGANAGAYLKLSESSLFPISTYQTLETDPLSLVTNNLSKISANEGGAVQVLIRPLSKLNLRKRGEKALKKIREGKPVRQAVIQAFNDPFTDMFEDMSKALFGKTAKEWSDINPSKKGNMRDYSNVTQLVVLANLESLNSELIKQSLSQEDRLIRLNKVAISQMTSLVDDTRIKKLEKK